MFRSSREGPTEEKAGRRMPIRLGTALIAATGLLLGPLALASSAETVPHAASAVMGTYVPVTPFRLVDTRTGATNPATYAGKTLVGASSLNVQVTGVGTVPLGAAAAVLNVTVTNTTQPGFITVFPEGTTQPNVSNLNFTAAETVANQVTVPLSSAGGASFFNSAGSTDLVVDVEGYYSSTPAANGTGLYNSISPVRALGALGFGAPVAANTSVPVTVTGTLTGVPATATAVVVSATAAHGTAASFLTVYPAGAASVPAVSNVNFSAGEAVANRVTVPVGTGGQIEVYNHSGTVDVDIDVDGYYTGVGGTGSAFVPITTPVRITDTRGTTPINGTPIAANTSESFNLATVASTIPATATSVAANFTVISGDASGYLSIYPASTTVHPVSSSINWTANETVPAFTIADTAGTGSVEVYNSAGGTINLLIDVFGYFEPVSNGPIMESAVVTHSTIAITYNENVSCAAAVDGDFGYFWTGAAGGGVITLAACTASSNVLTLTAAAGFTLPGSTGGSLVYTSPVTPLTTTAVYATGPVFAATQTLSVSAAAAPRMVSAFATATSIVVTYNEDVTCPTLGVGSTLFSYVWTGIATDPITGCAAGPAGSDLLTLTSSSGPINPPGAGASLTYTAPAAGNTPTTAVFATGSNPDLYAATQTLSGTAFTTPAITAATVNAVAGTIAVTYSESMTCPTGTAVQAVFEYTNGGAPAYPTTCSGVGVVTLGSFMTTATGTTPATLLLPGAADSLVYTSPATPAITNTVYATLDFPQFPATQTFALTATPAPAMVSAVVTNATTLTITYGEFVSCPATGADGDFVYDSAFNTLGGAITSCSASNLTLTLGGIFNPSTGAASIVYTAPATSTTANAVYAANSTSAFAATQTLFPL